MVEPRKLIAVSPGVGEGRGDYQVLGRAIEGGGDVSRTFHIVGVISGENSTALDFVLETLLATLVPLKLK